MNRREKAALVLGELTSVEGIKGVLATVREARALEGSLRAFVEAAWPHVDPSTFTPGWHIDAICEHLEALVDGRIKRLIINMPPRHGKSLLVAVMFPAWCWARDPSHRFLFCTYAQELSNRDSKKFRELVRSPWFVARWGHRFSMSGGRAKTAVKVLENDHFGHRIASSPGGEGTGRGGNVIACDDPNKVKDAESKLKREAINEWWSSEMPTRGNAKDASWLIVQQRIHERDLTGFVTTSDEGEPLTEEQHGYCRLTLPAEFEGNKEPNMLGFVDPREELDELLWPQGCDRERLEDIKKGFRGDAYKIAGQLQQRPVPRDGGMIKLAWLRRFKVPPADLDYMLISADFSGGSVKERASFNAFGLFGVKGQHVYLLDVLCFRGAYGLAKRRFIAFCKAYPKARAKIVEDTVNGRALLQDESHGIEGLIALPPVSKDKLERMDPHTPDLEAGYFHMPLDSAAQWASGCALELSSVPSCPNDDQFDMVSQALTYIRKPKRRARMTRIGGRR